jgi:DedD protein
MFTSRSASQGKAPAAPQSIEMVRQRARHRLIGAAVLVLLGVVGFSLLLDTQPRPLPNDIAIVIPAKNPPPAREAAKPAPASAPTPTPTVTERVSASESLSPREEVVTAAPAPARAPTPAPARPEPVKPEPARPAAAPAAPTEAERARALLEGRTAEAKPTAPSLRIVVQVGAFADANLAREARLKLERAGLKTYTHVAETPQGRRIRVRVGPFSTQAEADKAAARVKALGLPAAILTL